MKIRVLFFIVAIFGFFIMFRFVGVHSKGNKKVKTIELDTVTDIDGNKYQTIAIGKQVWMTKNLNVTHYRNGDSIPNVTDDSLWSKLAYGAYCNYDNKTENAEIYGRLYNWYAVNDPRGICPEGWHVPTDAEWQTLIKYLGGENEAPNKMKETGFFHWGGKNKEATNKSEFTALPGGSRHKEGPFHNLGKHGHWWTSTGGGEQLAWYRSIFDENLAMVRKNDFKTHGFSVRCIKDE